jgi:hypothetical protein
MAFLFFGGKGGEMGLRRRLGRSGCRQDPGGFLLAHVQPDSIRRTLTNAMQISVAGHVRKLGDRIRILSPLSSENMYYRKPYQTTGWLSYCLEK